jgi:hypothetical protein
MTKATSLGHVEFKEKKMHHHKSLKEIVGFGIQKNCLY